MVILTVYATRSDGYFDILIKQALKLNYSVEIVGWGQPWLGFYKRTLDLYEFFKSRPDNEIILCIDGFDSFILDDNNTLLRKYKSFNSPIVWGIEKNDLFLRQLVFRSKYNYTLNGGSFIGRNKYLKIVFGEIIKSFGTTDFKQDDQKIVNYMNNDNKVFQNYVTPDIDSLIFANVIYDSFKNQVYNYFNYSNNDNQEKMSHIIVNDKIVDKRTGISPSIISGPCNTNISHFIKHFNPDAHYNERKYNLFFINNFKYEIIFCILLILFIILIIAFICKKINIKK